MQIHQIESFVVVCETKSFTATAQQLYLSQPAISQHIRSLEKDLGCNLLEHQRHGVNLTPNGELFYSYAKDIVSLYRKARQALNTGDNMFCLHFVNASPNDPLQRCLLRFYTGNPRCNVELMPPIPVESFQDAANLDERHLYLVQKKWITDSSIHFTSLGHTRFSCILSPEDPLASLHELTLEDIKDRTICQHNHFKPVYGPFMHELYQQMSTIFPPIRRDAVGETSRIIARIISDRGHSVHLLPYYVSVMDQSGTIRRPLKLSGDCSIGLAHKGSLTPAMQEFIRTASNCYTD